jgi:2-methylisocitrate lyase-like PEP mutase family enzyme
VVKAVAPKPVNVLMGLAGVSITVSELADLGVKRISIGSALARVAYGSFLRSAQEISTQGTFNFAGGAVSYTSLNNLFA